MQQPILQAIEKSMAEINSAKNYERILHNILNQLVRILDLNAAAIVELNPDTELLEIRNSYNLSWNFCKNYRRSIDSSLLRELIWNNQDINIPERKHALKVVEQLRLEHEFVSGFATSLNAFQQPLGFLFVDSNVLNFFSDETQSIVRIFAGMISTAIYLERISQKLKKMERVDEESGALRFESYLPFLKENFHRSTRMNEPYSLLLLDVEKYSHIITQYGVKVAQSLLKEMVQKIKIQLRKYDEICRFGADEFLISLPATDVKNALQAAKKLIKIVQETEFTEKKLRVGVFIGIATFPENANSLNGLLIAVKNALMLAKRMSGTMNVSTISTKFD
ncbi:sensor domain-containing diguanylate cyclase [Caldithrix abyssi]|uniref:diguanylate cyclase n=1 Tax=Caldithrix abyssi DSM 13497 TaxID=880073 RepID=H1XW97_CALAY|nr:GGDEF domain-containing protein [Caldithrix abyssi]APF19061.1 diguanylate cyclase (GGDEF) domain-containing protein [Caldithrix abyssi DSM 13497]EHO43002.1 diguanylate cyclase with GAF sensor [Caldithrix abyssi DSM 13497]